MLYVNYSICSGTTSAGEDPPDHELEKVCFAAHYRLCLLVCAWNWEGGGVKWLENGHLENTPLSSCIYLEYKKPVQLVKFIAFVVWHLRSDAVSFRENLEQNHPSITLKARPFLVIKCLQKDALFKPFLELCMLKQRPFRLKHSCSFENEKSN